MAKKAHKPKRKSPQPSRLEKAQAWFSYLAREYKAIGIRMVNARLEFLEADAEERAKMHLEHPDDEVIKNAAESRARTHPIPAPVPCSWTHQAPSRQGDDWKSMRLAGGSPEVSF